MEDTKLFSFAKKKLITYIENFNCKNTQLLKFVVGKISFHSNAEEGQCQRMLKLPEIVQLHSFHMLEGNAQNPLSQASAVHEPRVSRCTSWVQKRQRNQYQIANIGRITEKARKFQKNIYFCFIDYAKVFDCVDQKTVENT